MCKIHHGKLFFISFFCMIFFGTTSSCLKKIDEPGFNPNGDRPLIITFHPDSIGPTSVVCGGNVLREGRKILERKGVCWSTKPMPDINDQHTLDGNGAGPFTSHITGLKPETNYFIRAYASDSTDTYYGNTVTFTTGPNAAGIVMDYDGNPYHTIRIGNQIWLMENLRVGHFKNGDVIPNLVNSSNWTGLSLAAYCVYLNDSLNQQEYGHLYNWYAVADPRGLAPDGWRIADVNDWKELISFLGDSLTAGGKLKEAGFFHWAEPNAGATNMSGFTALPSGIRLNNGAFTSISMITNWWIGGANGDFVGVDYQTSAFLTTTNTNKKFGLSIRCIKN